MQNVLYIFLSEEETVKSALYQVTEKPGKAEQLDFRKGRMVWELGSRRLEWESHLDAKTIPGAQVVAFLGLLGGLPPYVTIHSLQVCFAH